MDQSAQDSASQLLQEYTRFFETMMTAGLAGLAKVADTDQGGDDAVIDEGLAASEAPLSASVDLEKLIQAQLSYLQKQSDLWQSVSRAMLGEPADTVIMEAQHDRRFKHRDWSENPFYSFIKQSYLLNSNLLHDTIDSMVLDVSEQSEALKFFARQYSNALSPTNTLFGNPEVYRQTCDSQGENLKAGMGNLLRDLQQSPQPGLRMTQTDESAFAVGENLAMTPGSVVYQNDIMQLIQYAPTTTKVFQTPVLITPPYINKYYVLDLDEKKSLVRWLVSKGFTVFMISWVNPDEELAHKGFGDYVLQGPVEALDVVAKITGIKKAHLMGYCVGGTLSSLAAAYLKAQGKESLATLTLLTTLLDFSNPGEVGHYLSESSWAVLKQRVQAQGYMDGRTLAMGFSLLRENQLFWPSFINNYLKGETPEAFDILYWNGDSTHIPAANYIEYVDNTYRHNRLREAGSFVIQDTPIDLSKIEVPVYFLATRSDHIVLWDASYKGTQLVSGEIRFVLAGSGHLAGVINPDGSDKYGYCTNPQLPHYAEEWLEGAQEHEGSWWTDWFDWAQKQADKQVMARRVGSKKQFPVLEAAPGSYVKRRI